MVVPARRVSCRQLTWLTPSIDLSGKPQELTQPFTKLHIKTAKKKAYATAVLLRLFEEDWESDLSGGMIKQKKGSGEKVPRPDTVLSLRP